VASEIRGRLIPTPTAVAPEGGQTYAQLLASYDLMAQYGGDKGGREAAARMADELRANPGLAKELGASDG
jgi:hypothetical protein